MQQFFYNESCYYCIHMEAVVQKNSMVEKINILWVYWLPLYHERPIFILNMYTTEHLVQQE